LSAKAPQESDCRTGSCGPYPPPGANAAQFPWRYYMGMLGMVFLGANILFPQVGLHPFAAGNRGTSTLHLPRPENAPLSAGDNVLSVSVDRVSQPIPDSSKSSRRLEESVQAEDQILADRLVHVARRGESVTSLARRYLVHTPYMTVAELESAIRQVNGWDAGKTLRPGEQVIVPDYESKPVVEKPIPMAKDAEIRAIYLTGTMAGSRQGIQLIRTWKERGGNSIVFDIKDSDGSISVPFSHRLAPKKPRPAIQNLPKFARFLHSLGFHAIARIALFRDERLALEHPELAVRSRRTGQAWRENGKLVWVDPSQPDVQDFNLALAKHAAASGVDEIQFDYVRFPAEGDQKDTQFHFQATHPEWQRSDVISDFLAKAYSELHPLGVLVSLDVFGVMAWQRQIDLAHTGQDIPSMARHCDVLSPMIYPSHFFGMDGYAKPGDAPEHFIGESMERFQEVTRGTGVVLRPWLQAFGWRTKTYSAGYILTQVSVAKQKDGIGFMFWNARNDYSKPFVAMLEMRAAPERYFRSAHPSIRTGPVLAAPSSGPSDPPSQTGGK
jgi:hypothetical protein